MGAGGGEIPGRIKRGVSDMVDLARLLEVLGELGDDRQSGFSYPTHSRRRSAEEGTAEVFLKVQGSRC